MHGFTPFMIAVREGMYQVVNYLSLRKTNDLDQKDPYGRTCLTWYLLQTEEIIRDNNVTLAALFDLSRKLI